MSRHEEIGSVLRKLPILTPDPTWRERTKLKLMRMMGDPETNMSAERQWAVYVSSEGNLAPVADRIRARGNQWRPVAVSPERMTPALEAIQPVLVVIDSRLRDGSELAAAARDHSHATVISDRELAA